MQGSAVFNGVFELREGVSGVKAFYAHFIEWDSHPDIAF
jgi:hypothetical protein